MRNDHHLFAEVYHYQTTLNPRWEVATRWIDVPHPLLCPTVVVEYHFNGRPHNLHGPVMKNFRGWCMAATFMHALFGRYYEGSFEWKKDMAVLKRMVIKLEEVYLTKKRLRQRRLMNQGGYTSMNCRTSHGGVPPSPSSAT